MQRKCLGVLAIASLLGVAPAWAVNKCTGPDGKITFSDTLCPESAKTKEVVQVRQGNVAQSSRGSGSAQPRIEPNTKLETIKQAEPLMDYYRRWADLEKLLGATARVALPQPMGELQKLQREVEAYQAPACLDQAKAALVKLIAANSESMIRFMQKEELTNIFYQTRHRPEGINAFEGAIKTARCVE